MAIRLVKSPDEEFQTLTLGEMIIREYEQARQAKAEAELAFLEQEARLINMMGDTKSARFGSKRVTVVRRETTKIDDAKLKKQLGARLFNKITKPVIDRPKLESLISTGEINIDQVASASEIIPSKSYVKVSDLDDRSEEGDRGTSVEEP